jgi:hypothetical protein
MEYNFDGVVIKKSLRDVLPYEVLRKVEFSVCNDLVMRGHRGGEGLRFIRKACGISINEFAERFGMDVGLVSNIERSSSVDEKLAEKYYELYRCYG